KSSKRKSTICRPRSGKLETYQQLTRYIIKSRRAIYTTNAIESLNSVIRKAIKKRKLFPTDESARKVIYLAIRDASKKWTMPIRNWRQALNRFMIMFEDRLTEYM
ncbi:transposase, partial [Vibrio navarrensis]|uniref:transposase n=1 Tax=Vibrio navarrensis TaxID=29495 RepID=UPI00052E310D